MCSLNISLYKKAKMSSPAKLAKYCALVVNSHYTRFVYYSTIKLAGLLQFDMLILHEA